VSSISRLATLVGLLCLVAGCEDYTLAPLAGGCGVDFATGIDTCKQSPIPQPKQPSYPPTPPPQVVRVTPAQGVVAVGDTIRFVAIPYDSLNRVFVEPSQVLWTTSDSTVARIVSGPDHFDFKSGNSTAITVRADSRGTATLTVTIIVNNGGLQTSGSASVTTQ
jgi:hypothetical protein